MNKNCPECGLPLDETTHGNYFCPNHGKFSKEEIEGEVNPDKPEYIG